MVAKDCGLTRSQIKRLIDRGQIEVNGAPAKAGAKLSPGDVVVVHIPPPVPEEVVPQPMDLRILFEDRHLLLLDKPAPLVVHPSPGHPDRTLVNALLAHCPAMEGVGGDALRSGIVHRLDKDTTGVMVVAKDPQTHAALVEVFSNRQLTREYWAVVAPAPVFSQKTFDTLYGRHPVHRKLFSSRVAQGKQAITHCEVVERFGEEAALIRCRLGTGRTHQIRVHLADANTPLVGDPVYRKRYRSARIAELGQRLGRQALHARTIGFRHPVTGERMDIESPVPADMRALIEAARVGC